MTPRCSMALLAIVSLVLLTACGAEVHVGTRPKKIDGETLASKANAQLQQQNPSLVRGDLTCADVKYDVGATSRCLRTVVLKDGRVVRIGATVTIDKVTSGGHYKIAVDDKPQEFGLSGAVVLAFIAKQYAAKYGGKVPTGSCPPYLAGKVGTTMRCSLTVPNGELGIQVTVTGVDPKNYGTGYTYKTVR
jgi:hypothetical protein